MPALTRAARKAALIDAPILSSAAFPPPSSSPNNDVAQKIHLTESKISNGGKAPLKTKKTE